MITKMKLNSSKSTCHTLQNYNHDDIKPEIKSYILYNLKKGYKRLGELTKDLEKINIEKRF